MAQLNELVKAELALAREEVTRQIDEVKHAAIAMSTAAVLAVLGLSTLLVSLVLVISPRPLTALVIGIILLLLAGGALLVGYRARPKKPLERTQGRLRVDAQLLKEHLT